MFSFTRPYRAARPRRALVALALTGSTLSLFTATTHTAVAASKNAKKAAAKGKAAKKAPSKKGADKTTFGLSGLPVQFYTTWQYVTYLIYDKSNDNGKPVNVHDPGGTLTLGPNGSYEKKFSFPGPYGSYHFDETGHYRLENPKKSGAVQTGKITFTYTDSKGKPVTYGGTYNFHLKALSLVLTLNESQDGKEIFGLFVKGTENLKRHFDDNGNVVFE